MHVTMKVNFSTLRYTNLANKIHIYWRNMYEPIVVFKMIWIECTIK
jgi:hypothetical protein